MHLYTVPVIQPDLRHEETIIQAANALDYLQQVVNNVFDKIDARIDHSNQRISAINKRLEIANRKVDSLQNTNKAIKIFAPAKYPAASLFSDIPMTFSNSQQTDNQDEPEKISLNRNYQVKSGLDPIGHKNIQDKLKFYHVPIVKTNKFNITENIVYKDGLGNVAPSNIDSIDALLLFDKPENPYANYRNATKIDKNHHLASTSSSSRMAKSSTTLKMDAAPFSISNRKLGTRKIGEHLFYTPGLQSAPEIDVPFDLPDLPGIADDISFNVLVDDKQIAPSNLNTGLLGLPDLPDIMNQDFSKPADTVSLASSQKSSTIEGLQTKVDEYDSGVQLIPPPPPPMLSAPSVNQQAVAVNLTLTPPPPPPPPLPPIELLKTVSEKPLEVVTPTIKGGDDAARNNLMEAIRHAGGVGKAKLRAAAEQTPEKEKESTANSSKLVPGGNLMADLHNKLAMRRKGISGAKEQATTIPSSNSAKLTSQPANVMDRLSAMIPPPPVKQQQAATSSTTDASDDDWE